MAFLLNIYNFECWFPGTESQGPTNSHTESWSLCNTLIQYILHTHCRYYYSTYEVHTVNQAQIGGFAVAARNSVVNPCNMCICDVW